MAFVVRGEAASALGRLGGEGAVAALQAMVNDPMDSVSRRARQALALLRAEGDI
jgi:HEAT repeat protein